MKLTKFQTTVLRLYWCYHVDGWTLGPFLRVNWWRWLLLFLYVVVGGWLFSRVSPGAVGLVVGIAAGAFLRDIGHLVKSYRTWPVIHEITDWQRVEQLVQSHKHPGA
ncbi:MAG: hypothetical protein ACXWIU_06365 [Limisphaerales bacterium]